MKKIFALAVALMVYNTFGVVLFGQIYEVTNAAGVIISITTTNGTGASPTAPGHYLLYDDVDTDDAAINIAAFLTNLSHHIGSRYVVSNSPSLAALFDVQQSSMWKAYWYGVKLPLYNNSITQSINNNIFTCSNSLMNVSTLLSAVGRAYVRLTYDTYGNANPYTDVPGLRIGHTFTGVMTNPPIVLFGFGNTTQDLLLVVWKDPFMQMTLTNTVNYSSFPASIIQYEGTNYQTIAQGLAGYGFDTPNQAEIVLVTNGCATPWRSLSVSNSFALNHGSVNRAWWIYDKGRDFTGFRKQIVGDYSGTNNIINYMKQ
jgi:hypothetical protein